MKSDPDSRGALRRYFSAALLLSALPLTGQTITNPGFEADTFGVYPGYVSGNTEITGWTTTTPTRVGLNPAVTSAFANNGAVPEGTRVAFLQAGTAGTADLSTTVTGLTIGTKYKVSARVNARYQTPTANTPNIKFTTNGLTNGVGAEVTAVSTVVNATPYKTVVFEFTATAASQQITFTNNRTAGDHTLLIDDVKVFASDNTWSFKPWTGDLDSGVDSQYIYTHAVSLGSNPPVTVKGVNFIGRETGVPGRFTLTDLGSAFGNRVPNNVTGDSANLAKDFRYNGASTGITLANLKPNTAYVFTLYGLSFDAPVFYRSATFSSNVPGSQKLTVDVNQYGQGNGILVEYTYTTDASGTPVAISYPATGTGTFHSSGFSNREAAPGTQPVRWAVDAWMDDSTSGVSPNHVYTHAFNFGTTTGFNLNGINFTGLTGINPTGAGLTVTGMPAVYNNDTNAVTGFGSPMARDFIYGGFPSVYDLTGLTPGKDYVLTLYSMGWNDGARPGSFIGGIGEQAEILNQDTYGDNQGLRFVYQYTASAAGTAKITVGAFDGTKSIHTYGISNREADPMVGVAPTITLQPTGGSVGFGSSYALRVGATGSETLSYQWSLNGNPVGGNDPVLDLGVVESNEAGEYTVVVTNGSGFKTSTPVSVVLLENVPGVFGTGLGADGFPLAAGAVDPHFKLIVNPDNTNSQTTYVESNIPGAWLANSQTSKWIGPRADTAAAAALNTDASEGPGTYVYRTQVDLTGFDLATVNIKGSWASDNKGLGIRVNGTATGLVNDTGVTFGVLKPFVIDIVNAPGLIAGINTLDFVVNNEDAAAGFTGLRVDGLSAIGRIPANTPPHIVVQPKGGPGSHYGSVLLSVAASGSATLTYQWYHGANAIPGATDSEYYVDINDSSAAGDYKVVVSNGSLPNAESEIATITVGNSIPLIGEDSLFATKNTPLLIDSSQLLSNDTDADSDVLVITGFSTATFNGGTVTEQSGILTYTPAAGFTGLDGFTYTVSDDWGGTSAPGLVSIAVNEPVVVPPGQLTLVVDLSGGTVTGSFTGTPGVNYILQRSTTLMSDWEPVDAMVAPESGIVTMDDPSPPAGKAFYRIAYPK